MPVRPSAALLVMNECKQQFDVLIVGGGVIGCSIAWRLAQSGQRVAIFERGDAGKEASWAAGGMLAPLAEADRADEFFALCVKSRALYADFAAELKTATGIDIEYRTEGTLFLSLTEADDHELEERWRWQHDAGLNVKRLDAGCVRKLEPTINERLRWALKFPDDHQVNARQLMQATLSAAQAAGVQVFAQTEVRRLLSDSHAGKNRIVGVETTQGVWQAPVVVLAAGSWSSLLAEATHLPVTPVRGQMVAVASPTPAVRHVIYSRRGYVVPRASGFLIAGSTTEQVGFDRRVTAGGVASIIARAEEILPGFGDLALLETWAGVRPGSADEMPVLGEDPAVAGLIYATGHYRNGILLCPITAQLISELLTRGESSVNLTPFSVLRFAHRRAVG